MTRFLVALFLLFTSLSYGTTRQDCCQYADSLNCPEACTWTGAECRNYATISCASDCCQFSEEVNCPTACSWHAGSAECRNDEALSCEVR